MDLNLSLAEKRLLAALPKDGGPMAVGELVKAGFGSETEVLQAAGAPQRHGLVDLREQSRTEHSATEEGIRYQRDGLPERRLIAALCRVGGIPLNQLGVAANLNPEEVRIALGKLQSKKWARIEKDTADPARSAMVPLHPTPPPQGMDELVLLDIGKEPTSAREPNAVADLVARKLVRELQVKTRSLALTSAGKAVANALDPSALAATEVNQVTPELIAKWPSLSAAERAKQSLRPFDFGVAVAAQFPGKAHPLTHILAEARGIFWSMGFQEIAGDYVESAFWNMDALFIPQDHPARDMQDTFYLAEPARLDLPKADLDRAAAVHETGGNTGSTGWGGRFDRDVAQRALLRTHTTNTTIRYLAKHPTGAAKVFGLGRVFRKETMDATHLPEFTQIEGIVTEPGCTFNTLVGLCRHFFAAMGFPKVRFRPAYFPYTEPSMEIDVLYNGRWMELGGCGIFRPEVTKPLGVRDNVLAWGFGLERLAMMRLGLKDIRDLYISDVQWLRETPVR